MALNWGGGLSGAGSGAAAGSVAGPWGTLGGGVAGGLLGLFSGGAKGGGSTPNISDLVEQMIAKYSYMPQFTGQTESSIFDLFQRMTGQGTYSGGGSGDLSAVPLGLGLDTTGLYDAATRSIKEDYLGTPGAGESGRLADLRAYYNQLGVPEAAINAERLGNQDLNNSLLDQAAILNDNTKNRLTNILGTGSSLGSNLYAQNLNQHRFNTGAAITGLGMDVDLGNAISEGNNQSLASLLGLGTNLAYNPTPGSSNTSTGSGITSLLGNLFGGQTAVNSPYVGKKSNASSAAKLIT